MTAVDRQPRIEAVACLDGTSPDFGAIIVTHENLSGFGRQADSRAQAAYVVAAAILPALQRIGVQPHHIRTLPDSFNLVILAKNERHTAVIADVINAIPSLALYVNAALAVLGSPP